MSTPIDKTSNAMLIEVICANAVERAHTDYLDANDKLIQTRSHAWNTVMSRKRRFVMRKGKSTIGVLYKFTVREDKRKKLEAHM